MTQAEIQEANECLSRILAYEARAKAVTARIEQNAKQTVTALQATLKEAREICDGLHAELDGVPT